MSEDKRIEDPLKWIKESNPEMLKSKEEMNRSSQEAEDFTSNTLIQTAKRDLQHPDKWIEEQYPDIFKEEK